ncbi:MAG: twin-arginine translocase subunit TatC [Akkermansiaceae bacterium]|nr:twin-arginine translocase subunit TatC [Armatimonadota bacterium]
MANSPRTTEAQMELVEHLAELRTRLFRAALYLIVGMILAYSFFDPIFALFSYPLQPILEKTSSQYMFTSVVDPFLLQMQVSFIAGITIAFPFITLELWGFVEPALTPEERKPIAFLAPFSILLFLAGIATAYASLPACYGWMAGFLNNIDNVVLNQDPKAYILLTAKIMLAFGIGFELPVVLLFLARIGIINAELMTKYWRQATVAIFVAAATLTPSNDPLTMLMMAVPMAGLYLLSIGLVRAFEPKEGKSGPPISSLILVSLAPVAILGAASFWLWKTQAFNPQLLNKPNIKKVQQQVQQNKVEAKQSIDEVQSKFGEVLTRLDALEKENAELKARLAEVKAQPLPAPTPNPMSQEPTQPVNPEGGRPTDGPGGTENR